MCLIKLLYILVLHHLKNSLISKKSSGVDGINAIILEGIKYEICEPISTLINMSLEKGIVPACMKTAKVVPIYKSKQKDQFTNYRPISLLPTISNILEKIIHKRTYGFIERKKTYYTTANMAFDPITPQ